MKIKSGFIRQSWRCDEIWAPWIEKDIDYILGKSFNTEKHLAIARRFSVLKPYLNTRRFAPRREQSVAVVDLKVVETWFCVGTFKFDLMYNSAHSWNLWVWFFESLAEQ